MLQDQVLVQKESYSVLRNQVLLGIAPGTWQGSCRYSTGVRDMLHHLKDVLNSRIDLKDLH